MRLELPATRAAKAIVARYTDGDPTAAELGVPAPRRLTRPFGIINAVDGELQYAIPGNEMTENIQYENVDSFSIFAITPYTDWHFFSMESDLPYAGDATGVVSSYSFSFGGVIPSTSSTIASPATSGSVDIPGNVEVDLRNITFSVAGNTLTMSGEVRGPGRILARNRVSFSHRDVTVQWTTGDPAVSIGYPAMCVDSDSVSKFGYRPRSSPLIISESRLTVPPPDFMPDLSNLVAELQAELARYATPIPVFAIERACDTADHRADILARRLSDKVHLTADGPSMLGADLDAFIEAIQTTIAPTGEITQTLWIEAA